MQDKDKYMAFTYDDLIADSRIDLKDENGVTYKTPLMTKLVNDAVQIARKLLAAQNPEMIWTSLAINLVADNAGPYAITNDFESPVTLLDENGKDNTVGESYRGEYDTSTRTGKPDGIWFEGHAPANLYVNSKPDKAYAWTLYYIATAARVTVTTAAVPLPDFLREKLVAWIVKFAADSKEFVTTSEDQKIKLMEDLISDILISRRSKIVLNITGVGF